MEGPWKRVGFEIQLTMETGNVVNGQPEIVIKYALGIEADPRVGKIETEALYEHLLHVLNEAALAAPTEKMKRSRVVTNEEWTLLRKLGIVRPHMQMMNVTERGANLFGRPLGDIAIRNGVWQERPFRFDDILTGDMLKGKP